MSTIDVADVKATLISEGVVTGGRWSAFPIDPAKQEGHEDVVFSGLVNVNDSIVKAANLDQPRTCIFTARRPHKSPTSTRPNKTRPDGCRLHQGRIPWQREPLPPHDLEFVRWEDVVVAEEYKKRKAYDDVRDVSDLTPFHQS
jgi:hypothetical protein